MEEKDEKERSYIHIEFTEMGYTAHETSFKNVDPYQFFLVIEELKMIAQSGLVQQMQKQYIYLMYDKEFLIHQNKGSRFYRNYQI